MDPRDYTHPESGKTYRCDDGIWTFIPAPLPPEIPWTLPLINALSTAERDLSRYSALIEASPYPKMGHELFLRSEVLYSLGILGIHIPLDDLFYAEIESSGSEIDKESTNQAFDLLESMRYGVERVADVPLGLRLIRETQGRLVQKVIGGVRRLGEFRNEQNLVQSLGRDHRKVPFVPPPGDEVQNAMEELEKFLHSDNALPALIRSALLHYQFEAIHPFMEGNGRLGRLLIQLYLYETKLLPAAWLGLSEYFAHHPLEYADRLLAVERDADWQSWLIFFLCGISTQSIASADRLMNLQRLRVELHRRLAGERNQLRVAKLMEFLFDHPVFNLRMLEQSLKIPFKTADEYTARMVKAGIVRETTGNARNRIFQADAVLAAFSGQNYSRLGRSAYPGSPKKSRKTRPAKQIARK